MKNFLVSFFSFLLFSFFGGSNAYSGYIELDLAKKRFKAADINIDSYQLFGNFSYKTVDKDAKTVFLLQGKDISLGKRKIGNAQIVLSKKGNIVFIEQFKSSKFSGSGTVDLKKEKVLFSLEGNWQEDIKDLKGDINLKIKIWGDFDSLLISGNFTISGGIYEGVSFKKLRCNFLGTPPVFNVTDAEVLLDDGSVFELKGDLDIRDSENFFPGVEFVSQRLFVDGWQIFGRAEEVGLKKQIDDKFYLKIDAEPKEEGGTELRYNLKNDNFLKLRMQEEKTILGVENIKEF
ncbi:MAG: hypothetical protein K9L95_04105 [Candidatus Omnitrophica bacterium]|nr:hypothetical protein [Candidatus Omnitrophota bacterium]